MTPETQTDAGEDVAGLVERLRSVPQGQSYSFPSTGPRGEPCKTVVPSGNMMHEAADALTRLNAENTRLRQALAAYAPSNGLGK